MGLGPFPSGPRLEISSARRFHGSLSLLLPRLSCAHDPFECDSPEFFIRYESRRQTYPLASTFSHGTWRLPLRYLACGKLGQRDPVLIDSRASSITT